MKANGGLSLMQRPLPSVNRMTAGLGGAAHAVGGHRASRASARCKLRRLPLGRTGEASLIARCLGQTAIALSSIRRENFPGLLPLLTPGARAGGRRRVVRRVQEDYVGRPLPSRMAG